MVILHLAILVFGGVHLRTSKSWEHISNPSILDHSNSAVKICSSVRNFSTNKKVTNISHRRSWCQLFRCNHPSNIFRCKFEEDSTHFLMSQTGSLLGDFPLTLGQSGEAICFFFFRLASTHCVLAGDEGSLRHYPNEVWQYSDIQTVAFSFLHLSLNTPLLSILVNAQVWLRIH